MSVRTVEIRDGELIVLSQKAADMVRSQRDLHGALMDLTRVSDLADDLRSIAEAAERALAREPRFDAIPTYVQVDSSWADALPPCVVCDRLVPWADALLMPCSSVEDGDVDGVGVVHRHGCPDREAA